MSSSRISRNLIIVDYLSPEARRELEKNLEKLMPYIEQLLENDYIPLGTRIRFPTQPFTIPTEPSIEALVPVSSRILDKIIEEWSETPPSFHTTLVNLYRSYVEENRPIYPIVEIFNLVPLLPSGIDLKNMRIKIERELKNKIYQAISNEAEKYNIVFTRSSPYNILDNLDLRRFCPVIEVEGLGYIPLLPIWNYYKSDLAENPIIVRCVTPEEYIDKLLMTIPSWEDLAEKTLDKIVEWIVNRFRPVINLATLFTPRSRTLISIRNMDFARITVKHGPLTGFLGCSLEEPILFLNLSLEEPFHPTMIFVPSREKNLLNIYKLLSWLESLDLADLFPLLREKIGNRSIYLAISEEPEEYYPAVKKYSGRVPLIVKLVMNSELRSLLNRAKPYNAFLMLRSLLNKIGREAAARYTMQLEEEGAPLRLIYEISNKKPRLVGVEKINNIL